MKIFNKKIKENFDYEFEVEEGGSYAIEIIASCKSWWQNLIKFISFFKDDDLAVKIDDVEFPKLNGKKGLFDAEAAWNGNNLKGLKKTNIFLIKLEKGNHSVHFLIDQEPYLESVNIFKFQDSKKISYTPESNNPPEDGNRRQWLNIILVNLSLKNLSIAASAGKRERDDDDLKLIIDAEIQKNTEAQSHKYWYWCGRTLEGKKKEFQKEINLLRGLHYIELWADRMPVLGKIQLGGIERKIFGRIVLHQDIEKTDFVNLRSRPDYKDDSNIITRLKDGDLLEILDERVFGSWVSFKSYIWHKVKWQDKEGYILSSFVEIEGQEREVIVEKIKNKARELKIDENLVLALAGCESKFKPYAASRPFEEQDERGRPVAGRGIFQLTNPAIDQLLKNQGQYYYKIDDPFDINQNIEGGIRYIKWLYDTYYKGVDQKIEKLIAAYNQGQGYFPPNEPLDYSRLPTKEKQEEAEQAVKCVLENKKRGNWQLIFWPLLTFLFIFVGYFSVWYLNQIDFFEPIYSEKDYIQDQLSGTQTATVILNQDGSDLLFVNKYKDVLKRIPTILLNVEEIFRIPPEFRQENLNLIHLGGAVEAPENTFYFLIATSWTCGANNCGWALYKYDADRNFLDVIEKDILGATELYLSSNAEKLALVSHIYGGFCNSGGYLKIIDLDTYGKEAVEGFEDEKYTAQSIESLIWKNNEGVEFKVNYGCNKLSKESVEKVFDYNLKSKKIKLIEEKHYDYSAG